MGRIQILDEQIANLIAAGEVIERPASVVKELMENALDANSTKIEVWIEQGGLQRIYIKDNGIGMDSEDCAIAFQRHATSKIRNSRDLFKILTLGFRGEALPSIAAVSKTACLSCADESGAGTKVWFEGGKWSGTETIAAPRGTSMDVRDLFFNTPARLKYMKSIQTEFGQIADVVQRLALARPDVAFELYHDEKRVLRTSGRNDVLEVIAELYGRDVAKQMVPIHAENVDVKIHGFLTKPEMTRSNRHGITWLVNQRYIRSTMLNQALLDGYHTWLPLHRYPVAVIHVEMDAQLLDVNVHPAKWDVRFSKEASLRDAVIQGVESALRGTRFIPEAVSHKSEPNAVVPTPNARFESNPYVREQISTFEARPTNSSYSISNDSNSSYPNSTINKEMSSDKNEHVQLKLDQWGNWFKTDTAEPHEIAKQAGQVNRPGFDHQTDGPIPMESTAVESTEPNPISTPKHSMPTLHPIGQAHGMYIVAQDDSGIYLVDQHAAHERIHYEKFFKRFGQPDSYAQPLLVAYPFELPADESAWLQTILPQLEGIGLQIETFGQHSFVVREHPDWLPTERITELIQELIEWMVRQRKTFSLERFRDHSAKMAACKASIRANDRISILEMTELLNQLQACESPYTCPHGRPIIVKWSTYELEKLFKRVM